MRPFAIVHDVTPGIGWFGWRVRVSVMRAGPVYRQSWLNVPYGLLTSGEPGVQPWDEELHAACVDVARLPGDERQQVERAVLEAIRDVTPDGPTTSLSPQESEWLSQRLFGQSHVGPMMLRQELQRTWREQNT